MYNRPWSDDMYGFGPACGWFGPFLTVVIRELAIAGTAFIVNSREGAGLTIDIWGCFRRQRGISALTG